MAEVVGIFTTAVLILSVVSNVATFTSRITKLSASGHSADSRVETLKWRIITEKLKTEEWANNVTINGTEISPERMATVDEITGILAQTAKKASDRLDGFLLQSDRKTMQRIRSHYRWDSGGYDEVKDLADLMQALNEALRTLIPPLPSYPGMASPSAPTEDHVEASQPVGAPVLGQPRQIYMLFQACNDAMSTLGHQNRETDEEIAALYSRLRLWGSGIFESAMDLDSLTSQPNRDTLRQYILSQLIDIAVVQEHLLLVWISQATGPTRSRLESCRETTRVALIGDGITQLGIERWYALQAEERFDPKPPEAHIPYIASLIEIHFDILPAIRGIRHENLLRAEADSDRVKATKTTAQSGNLILNPQKPLHQAVETSSQAGQELSANELDTLDLVDNNIRQVQRIPLQSPLVEKSCGKLEQWSREAAWRRGLAQQADNAEVRKMQEAISNKLAKISSSTDAKKARLTGAKVSEKDMEELGGLLSTAASQLRFVS